MSKKYTQLSQVFRAIVEGLAEASNPNRRYRVPEQFEDLFRKVFPEADGNPGEIEDSEIDAFVQREILISRELSSKLEDDEVPDVRWSQLEDPRTSMN